MSNLMQHLSICKTASVFLTALLAISWGAQVQAQPIQANDGTGTDVTHDNNPNQFDIKGGTISGANLFHSFTEFGLQQHQIANFLSTSNIQNILARVTGGNASYIEGIVKVTGGNSHLFLMNPAGFIFGTNASLNVPASFTATTANGIGIGNSWFNAFGNNNYATLVGNPNAFAFTMSQPGAIINAADLFTQQGQNLTLLGGTVVSTGQLTAPGGQVIISAVPGESVVRLSLPGQLLSLDIQPIANAEVTGVAPLLTNPLSLPDLLTGCNCGNATQLKVNSNGSVELTGAGAGVEVTNGDAVTFDLIYRGETDTGFDPSVKGGSVLISAEGNLTTGKVSTASLGGFAGSITLEAKGDILTTDRLLARHTLGGGAVTVTAGGNIITGPIWSSGHYEGGPITVTAGGDITFQPYNNSGDSTGALYSRTEDGNAGNINITAGGNINIPDSIDATAEQGNGGNVSLISKNGNITTDLIASGVFRQGNAGTITLDAFNDINLRELFSGTFRGKGGDISIKTGNNINIESGALYSFLLTQCGTSGAFSVGCGSNGTVTVSPTDGSITTYPAITLLFGSLIGKITIQGGDVNVITLPADNLLIPNPNPPNSPADNLPISNPNPPNSPADNLPISDPNPPSSPPDNNRNTTGNNPSVSITDLSTFSGTQQGDGGNFNVKAGGDISFGTIVTPTNNGNGGNIDVRSGGKISTNDLYTISRTNGNGGDVTLIARESIYTGRIDTYSFDGSGKKGNILAIAPEIRTGQQLSTPGSLNDAVLKIERQRKNEFTSYFGEEYSFGETSAESIRESLSKVKKQIAEIQPAVVYVSVFDDQLEFIIIAPGTNPIYRTNKVGKKVVEDAVKEFRNEVSDPNNTGTSDYLPKAQQLYQQLIAPIEKDLQKLNIDTLLFSPDAGLRSLPFAALHDGKQFLVEKYRLSLIPSVTLTTLEYKGVQDAQVLAMGASKFLNGKQDDLSAVPTEVATIANQLWSGKFFLDEEFTQKNLMLQSRQRQFQIIHLATHADFRSRNDSYIQLWDSKLRLDQLRKFNWYKSPQVELLVLSACRTALGNEEAEMGFAGLAVQAGVKSAVASLWNNSDVGTLVLMTEFYAQLKTAPIKAEALRQAQIAMLQGKAEVVSSQLRGSEMTPGDQLKQQNLLHPHYWAAFTMIGSPW